MVEVGNHLIYKEKSIKEALAQLDKLAADAIVFAVDDAGKLVGSLTDGDVRRGFLKDLTINNAVKDFIQKKPKYVRKDNYSIQDIIDFRNKDLKIIPVLDAEDKIIRILNFRNIRSYLPVDAVIMAGGRGQRLRPLTDTIPKPLLKIGEKPIIEHNLDHLRYFGVDDFHISVKYLAEQIENFLGDGQTKDVNISYIKEELPLGTIGSVSLIENLKHDTVLLTNSDILTNINYEDFYLDFLNNDASVSIVTIPYAVDIPYAVLDVDSNNIIRSFKEKPTYTYYSNGGIYLFKKEVLSLIPKNMFYNATDLIERLIKENYKVVSYPLRNYWLDIGKHEDYKRAQEDIKQLRFT